MHPSNRGGGDPRFAHGSTGTISGYYPSSGNRRHDGQHTSAQTPRNALIIEWRRRSRARYLPLSFCMSGVDGLFIILSGAAVLLELLSGAIVPDEVGGVAVLEPVLGGVVDDEDDDDGDGVTTGGVVDDVGLDSRWQPETPSAMPVQSNVTRAALLIVISRSG
jgi:hypothetical protein